MIYKFFIIMALIMTCSTFGFHSAHAQSKSIITSEASDMPIVSSGGTVMNQSVNTHPILRITPDKSEMISLDKEAASVIVGNPNHISVLLDTPTTLVVVPRSNGASHFSVIGKDGSVIMQRHVIVGAAKDQYVRIRRSCSANSRNCQPISTYFCPDSCHEVTENAETRRR